MQSNNPLNTNFFNKFRKFISSNKKMISKLSEVVARILVIYLCVKLAFLHSESLSRIPIVKVLGSILSFISILLAVIFLGICWIFTGKFNLGAYLFNNLLWRGNDETRIFFTFFVLINLILTYLFKHINRRIN